MDEAMEKQRRSEEEEPMVMQRSRDPEEAVVKQRSRDEAKGCPGLDHPRQNKKEWPKQNDGNKRSREAGRTGLDHPRRNKQQQPPPPGVDHPGTSGG